MEFGTEKGVRDFLGLCLDPGHGCEKRTPLQLTQIMPEPLLEALGRYAPHLAELRKAAEFRDEQGRLARQMYADGHPGRRARPGDPEHACAGPGGAAPAGLGSIRRGQRAHRRVRYLPS